MKPMTGLLLLMACKSTLPGDTTAPDDGGGSGRASSLTETYARAAAVAGSCIPDDGINRNMARFWDPLGPPNFWSRFRAQARCLATSGGGCAAARTCLGYQVALGGPACTTSCAGGVVTACGQEGGRTVRFNADCGKVGLSCDPLAFCSDARATACAFNDFVPSCAEGRGLFCNDDATARTAPCDGLQLTCDKGQCTGTGAACPGGFSSSEGQVDLVGLGCEGSRLRACVGGKEQMIDCAGLGEGQGFSCQTAGGTSFCGLGAECVPSESASGTTTCEGSTVVFCNAGRLQRVDCAALGFTGCDLDAKQGHYGCIPGLVPVELP
jgi:hypothetical protein